jgi:diaminopimelate decarboxylase
MSNSLAPDWLEEPSDLNALDGRVWPSNFVRQASGECAIAGVSVRELAAQFGTPLYVIDEDDFRQRALSVKSALEDAAKSIGTTAKIYYASKAFMSVEIASWINELQLNIDVASGGELAAALASGISADRIGLHGNNKSTREIARAITAGVGAIVLDSEIEIERVAAAAAPKTRFRRFACA